MNIKLINYLLDRFQKELADNWIVNLKDYVSAYDRCGNDLIHLRYGYLYLHITDGRFHFQYDLAVAQEMYEKNYVTANLVYIDIKTRFEDEYLKTLWKEKSNDTHNR